MQALLQGSRVRTALERVLPASFEFIGPDAVPLSAPLAPNAPLSIWLAPSAPACKPAPVESTLGYSGHRNWRTSKPQRSRRRDHPERPRRADINPAQAFWFCYGDSMRSGSPAFVRARHRVGFTSTPSMQSSRRAPDCSQPRCRLPSGKTFVSMNEWYLRPFTCR